MKTCYIFLLMLTVFITNTLSSPRRYIPKYQQIQNSEEMTDSMATYANSEQSKYHVYMVYFTRQLFQLSK